MLVVEVFAAEDINLIIRSTSSNACSSNSFAVSTNVFGLKIKLFL
jgi:hypothetical protein